MQTNTQSYFYTLADFLNTQLKGDEIFTSWLSGERSDFIRLNQSKIRQPGSVNQYSIELVLIDGKRHAGGELRLSGDSEVDRTQLKALLEQLRNKLPFLPEDPHLLYATEQHSSELIDSTPLPSAEESVSEALQLSEGLDLVGIYAQGQLERGFANSLGQRNWFSRGNFNFDWSLYSHGDKAVKCSYAGLDWDSAALEKKFAAAREQLPILTRPAKTIPPGNYRVYLTPSATHELFSLLSWSAFSRKATRTRQTPLLKLVEGEETLSPLLSISEQTAEGIGPDFEAAGFIKSKSVSLIEGGRFVGPLTSPRSAKEFQCQTDGANASEVPEALQVAGGSLKEEDILKKLDTGLYISNLWYLNFSDRTSCRVTGMTRFATFWVENGEITAPLNVMRFDESMYRALGPNLVDLTEKRDFILDPDTYYQRSCTSAKLPGALIDQFRLTL